MMIKYGFIYIWYDTRRKMFYLGCHWGTEDDGYICSSNRMRDAYRRRPQDFKRRVVFKIYTNRQDLLEEEHRWLQLIPEDQLGKKYYNLHQHHYGHWAADETKSLTIKEKLSQKTKEIMNRPGAREKLSEQVKIAMQRPEVIAKQEESKERRAKIVSKVLTGIKRSEETKEKIRQANLGKKHSEETKQKMRLSHNRDYSCPIFREKCRVARNKTINKENLLKGNE